MSERRGKYNARPTVIDGHRFASAAEARRYSELKLLEAAGEISDLALHPIYLLLVNDVRVCDYVADFQYIDREGFKIVEDVKGVRTAVYKIKKKLMFAVKGIEITEVQA